MSSRTKSRAALRQELALLDIDLPPRGVSAREMQKMLTEERARRAMAPVDILPPSPGSRTLVAPIPEEGPGSPGFVPTIALPPPPHRAPMPAPGRNPSPPVVPAQAPVAAPAPGHATTATTRPSVPAPQVSTPDPLPNAATAPDSPLDVADPAMAPTHRVRARQATPDFIVEQQSFSRTRAAKSRGVPPDGPGSCRGDVTVLGGTTQAAPGTGWAW